MPVCSEKFPSTSRVKCDSTLPQPREFIAGLKSAGRAFQLSGNGQCLQSVKRWLFNYNKCSPAPRSDINSWLKETTPQVRLMARVPKEDCKSLTRALVLCGESDLRVCVCV